MNKKIPIEALGTAYGVAIERMYEVITNYSEDLYTSDGKPKEDPGEVSRVIDSMISKLRHEASLARDSSYEYWEANAKPEQEELF
jgi:hypothetical protein